MNSHKQTIPEPIPGGREWSPCELCGKYRPLEMVPIGNRNRLFVCDDCMTTDDDIRWYFEVAR